MVNGRLPFVGVWKRKSVQPLNGMAIHHIEPPSTQPNFNEWRTAEKSIRSSRNSIFKWKHTKRFQTDAFHFKLRNKGHFCSLFCIESTSSRILVCYALSKNIKSKNFILWKVPGSSQHFFFYSCSSSSYSF